MSIVWRKLTGHLQAHRGQWLAMIAAMVLGGAGMIAAQTAQAILEREIPANFERSHPADLVFWFETATPEALDFIRKASTVAAAEMRGAFTTRIQTPQGKWLPLRMTIAADPLALSVGNVFAEAGTPASSSNKDGLLIERSALSMLQRAPGTGRQA